MAASPAASMTMSSPASARLTSIGSSCWAFFRVIVVVMSQSYQTPHPLASTAHGIIASWPVSRVLSGGEPSATAIHLGLGSLPASSNQPGRRPGSRLVAWACARRPCRPYSVLLPVGFAVPPPLPETRCALTAPFHPYLRRLPCAGGLLSVALSLGSPPAAVSRHRRSLEPGLSSTGRFWPRS